MQCMRDAGTLDLYFIIYLTRLTRGPPAVAGPAFDTRTTIHE